MKFADFLQNIVEIILVSAMRTFLIFLSVSLFILGGCKSDNAPAKLDGMKWILKTLNGKDVVLSDPQNQMFIFFNDAEKRVNGRAACNRFFGDYEITDVKLKFSPVGATRMACPNDSKWESEFFLMLENVDGYVLKDSVLSFLTDGEKVAEFVGTKININKDTHKQ